MMLHRYSCAGCLGQLVEQLSDGRHNVTVEPRRYAPAAGSRPRCAGAGCIAPASWLLVVRRYG